MQYQNEGPIVSGYSLFDPENVGNTDLGNRVSRLIDEDASELMGRLELQLLVNTENARTRPIDFALAGMSSSEGTEDIVGADEDSDQFLLVVDDVTTIAKSDISRMHELAPRTLVNVVPGMASRVFRWCNRELYQLLCDEGSEADRARLVSALGAGDEVSAGLVAAVLVSLGIAKSIAVIVALLVVKYILDPVVEEVCAHWRARLDFVPV